MRTFDYSFLHNGLISVDLFNIAITINELKFVANNMKDGNKKIFLNLESIAKIQSIKGSNAIEGIITTDKRIEEIVNKDSAPLNHNEAEIAGYRDVLSLIHSDYNIIQMKERDILDMHSLLLRYTGTKFRGVYKDSDNVIMESDKSGNRKVRFEPVSALETPQAMQQMLLAYLEAKNNPNVNQLLLIPCVIFDFLCIHPFNDGNGRMSRLLSLLLLYKNGFDAGKYISFEEQINKNKEAYYEALRKSSIGWHEGKNDYMPFIRNFISTLLMCYQELDSRFSIIQGKNVSKHSQIEALILGKLFPISKSEICKELPNISVTTIEKVIKMLLNEGKIEKIGTFKDAKYIRK